MCVWAGRGGGGDLSNWCFKVPRDPLVGLVSPTPLTHTLLPTPLCRTTRPEGSGLQRAPHGRPALDRHVVCFILEVVEFAHHRRERALLHRARGAPLGEHAVGADAVDAGKLVPSEG